MTWIEKSPKLNRNTLIESKSLHVTVKNLISLEFKLGGTFPQEMENPDNPATKKLAAEIIEMVISFFLFFLLQSL